MLGRSWESSFGTERQRLLIEGVKESWPIRKTTQKIKFCDKGSVPERMGNAELFDAVMNLQLDDSPRSLEEQVARVGIDITLFKLVGGSKDLASWVGPEGWCRYASVNEGHKLLDRAQPFNAAFRYYLSRIKGPFAGIHGDYNGPEKSTRLTYIAAPNGAGKSTYVRRHPKARDMDELVYQSNGWRKKWDMDYKEPWRNDLVVLCLALRRAVDQGAEEVCGQWPIKSVIKAGDRVSVKIKVRIVEPEKDVLLNRWRLRGWDETEQRKRWKRWEDALRGFEKQHRDCML